MNRKIKEKNIKKTKKSSNTIPDLSTNLSTETQELLNKIENIKTHIHQNTNQNTHQNKMTKTNKVDREYVLSKRKKNINYIKIKINTN